MLSARGARFYARYLGAALPERTLSCEVQPVKPSLGFTSRFQTGYRFEVPMRQYAGPGHGWTVVARVTPDESERPPVDFLETYRLRPIPRGADKIQGYGAFIVGAGGYSVRWVLVDEQRRVCSKEWHVVAEPHGDERHVKTLIAPGSVTDMSLRGIPRASRMPDPGVPRRLTILLDAAPFISHRQASRISNRDRMDLMNALSCVVERMPSSSIRLIAFNLEQQAELYRNEEFSLDKMEPLATALRGSDLLTVDARALGKPGGHVQMLLSLLQDELDAENRPDAVLFVGPRERYTDKLPRDALRTKNRPRFYFVQLERLLTPSLQSGEVQMPLPKNYFDMVSNAVHALNGATMPVYSAGTLAKAIERMERDLSGER